MVRLKTYDATGVAPNGRLFAGDLNLLQDTVAALTDYAQNIAVGTIAIGDSSLTISKFGTGELQVSNMMRVLGVFRVASGIVSGSYTTTARDALVNPVYGLVILNSTTNQYEWNSGTPAVPVWTTLGSSGLTVGVDGAKGAASATNKNKLYFSTDVNGGTLYGSTGVAWQKLAPGLTEAPPDGSITTVKIVDGAVTSPKLAAGAGEAYGTAFPTTGLYNGYRFTIFISGNAYDCIYRADLDATYPWHVISGAPIHIDNNTYTVVRSGYYSAIGKTWVGNGGTATGSDITVNMYFNGVVKDTTVQNAPNGSASGTGNRGYSHFALSARALILSGQAISFDVGTGDNRLKVWPERLI